MYRHWGSVQAIWFYSFLTMALEGVRGLRHAPAALHLRERPGTHCTGGWVGGKSSPHRDSIPDCQARSSVAIPSELPAPPHIYIYIIHVYRRYLNVSGYLSSVSYNYWVWDSLLHFKRLDTQSVKCCLSCPVTFVQYHSAYARSLSCRSNVFPALPVSVLLFYIPVRRRAVWKTNDDFCRNNSIFTLTLKREPHSFNNPRLQPVICLCLFMHYTANF